MATFVLIHSPLVGPFTWALVAEALRRKGHEAIVPHLSSEGAGPYWEYHAAQVRQALAGIPHDRPVILVGHSGAGPLLPAVRQGLVQPLRGYIFVDAGLPQNNRSRLEMFDFPDEVEAFRRRASEDGLLPTWTEDDLAEVIPDNETHRRFVADLRPMPLDVYEERLPVFDGWPDAPCGYIRFSPAYDAYLADARRRGWPCHEFGARHFHMLVQPETVCEALINISHLMEP